MPNNSSVWVSSTQSNFSVEIGGAYWGEVGTSSYLVDGGGASYLHTPGTIDRFMVDLNMNTRLDNVEVTFGTCKVIFNPGDNGPKIDMGNSFHVNAGPITAPYWKTLSTDFSHSFYPNFFGFRFTPDDPAITVSRFTCNSSGNPITGSGFIAMVGQIGNTTNEVSCVFHPSVAGQPGKLKNASVSIGPNSATGPITIILRVNGADTPISMTIPAGATGWFHDTAHEVTVDGFDIIDWRVVQPDGSFWLYTAQVDFITTNGVWSGGLGQTARSISNGATRDFSLGGLNTSSRPTPVPIDSVLMGLGIQIPYPYGLNGTSTFEAYVNGVATGLIVNIPHNTSGYFNITGGSVVVHDGDMIFFRLKTGIGSGDTPAWGIVDFTMQTTPAVIPPPPPKSGLYKIIPNSRKTNDTLWNGDFGGTTDVKIPDPFGRSFYA